MIVKTTTFNRSSKLEDPYLQVQKLTMIRPYKLTDKERLLKVFSLNTPKFFDENEIKDFEAYLEQKADTYLTIEVDGLIVLLLVELDMISTKKIIHEA